MASKNRTLYPLYTAADRDAAAEILKSLEAQGLTVSEKPPKKNGVLLLFLSEAFREDEALQSEFLKSYAKGLSVIPVSLNDASAPEPIENALYAYNTIFASRYSKEELTARITSAEALQKKKSRLPVLLSVSAGILLLIAGGIVAWRLWPKKTPTETTAETTETEAVPDVYIPKEAGLRPEDLARVYECLIVGDTFFYTTGNESWIAEKGWARVGVDYLANRSPQNDEGEFPWYSTEDGHEIEMKTWADLEFLKYMKNMKFLSLLRVDGTLPDLTGLQNLENIEILDSSISNIQNAAAPNLQYFSFFGDTVPDLSALNHCGSLQEVYFHFYGMDVVDLSNFGPASLKTFRINGNYTNTEVRLDGLKKCPQLAHAILIRLPNEDLSFLSECSELEEVGLWELWNLTNLHGLERKTKLWDFWTLACFELSDLSALSDASGLKEVDVEHIGPQDLSWLSGAQKLSKLTLSDTDTIRSFHGLENHSYLTEVRCDNLAHLTDISALGSCESLERLCLNEAFDLSDFSAVVNLPKLRELQTYGNRLDNVDFLYGIKNKNGFSFGISSVENWSGLQAIQNYEYLNITNKDGTALQYIQHATVEKFEFYNRSGRDEWGTEELPLQLLPEVTESIRLYGVPSLRGLPAYNLTTLEIMESPYLTSLDGVQNLPKFQNYFGHLYIEGCPRLTDWSALDGLNLSEIQLVNTFSLPEFSKFFASSICLNGTIGLTDLHCFDNLKPDKSCSIRLTDLDEVQDLSPLYTMEKGFMLSVPAHLQAQAQALVDSGIFKEYDVTYPDHEWSLADLNVQIVSLEELETLPDAVVASVSRFAMAGDILFNPDEYWVEEDWRTNPTTLTIVANNSDERIPVEDGTKLQDLSKLSRLTGLQDLRLYRQPLQNLSGIQALKNLENLQVVHCPDLTDASDAFTLQGLRWVDLQDTALESIEGIQNLYELENLNINNTRITDFSPLGGCREDLQVYFGLPLMSYEEFCALPAVVLSRLRQIMIAGDYVCDPWSDWRSEEDWSTNPTSLYLHVNSTDERIPLTKGSLTDLSTLPDLPQLETLYLFGQSIQSLSGIEKLPSLRSIELSQCRDITDISALFDQPNIHEINIRNSGLRSIEGVEKLPELQGLQIGGTQVTDLSVLERIDYSYAEQPDEGGYTPHFRLGIDSMQNDLPKDQYDYLSCVPYYDSLNVFNTDCRLWLQAVQDTPIRSLHAGNCQWTNEALREFVERHPEIEEIKLSWSPASLDLSPLLDLPNLRTLTVSYDMEGAIQSLGEDYGFELNIEY